MRPEKKFVTSTDLDEVVETNRKVMEIAQQKRESTEALIDSLAMGIGNASKDSMRKAAFGGMSPLEAKEKIIRQIDIAFNQLWD